MDALSSSLSNLKSSGPHSSSREFYTATPPPPQNSHLLQQSALFFSIKPSSISDRTYSLPHKAGFVPPSSPPSSPSHSFCHESSSPFFHRNPATGYAAALIDIAQSHSTLESVQNDVNKLLKILKSRQVDSFLKNPLMGEREKGEAVREMASEGGFHWHLLRLVKMLVEKEKVGILKEVLEEFERIHDELTRTRLVLVSSATKMEEGKKLFWIAKRVQKLSEAFKVKIKNFGH